MLYDITILASEPAKPVNSRAKAGPPPQPKFSWEEPMTNRLTRRTLLAGTAASALAAPAIVRAQGSALKVGVLLPRSGYQASIGQDCFRGVELTNPILKDVGFPEL